MKAALETLVEELRRRKAEGETVVAVSEESLELLRRVARARSASASAPVSQPASGVSPVAESGTPAGTVSPAARSEPAEAPFPVPTTKPPATRAAVADDPAAIPPPPALTLPSGSKQARWDWLLDRVANDPVCKAHVRPKKKVVLGVGNLDADLMFVGEAPGGEEEIQGEPFVGPAGQLLTKMIQAMGLQRSDVYIGNIMNWRPEMPLSANGEQYGNRPPSAAEMGYCLPFLKAQVAIVQPKLLVALGATAASGLLGAGAFKALGEMRGKWREFEGTPLMVTYHPSYILRNQSNKSKRMIWEDLLKVMDRAGLDISEKQQGYFLDK